MTRSAPNLLKSASLAPVLLAGLPSLAGAEAQGALGIAGFCL